MTVKSYVDGVNNSYGAAGFHLTFQDPDNLGLDTSGNQNNFTANGFNVISPSGYTFTAGGVAANPPFADPDPNAGINAPFANPSQYI